MACIHGGYFVDIPSINTCLRDPKLLKLWGVDKPTTILGTGGIEYDNPLLFFSIGDERYNIMRHPHFFVSEEVRAWYHYYSSADLTSNVLESELNPLYVDAKRIYERYKQETGIFVRKRDA